MQRSVDTDNHRAELDPDARRGRCSPAGMIAWHSASFAARIANSRRSVEALAAAELRLGVGPPQGREWFDLLQRKLLPHCKGRRC